MFGVSRIAISPFTTPQPVKVVEPPAICWPWVVIEPLKVSKLGLVTMFACANPDASPTQTVTETYRTTLDFMGLNRLLMIETPGRESRRHRKVVHSCVAAQC